jgi:hypothetical protein
MTQPFLQIVDRSAGLQPINRMPVPEVVEGERPKFDPVLLGLVSHALYQLVKSVRGVGIRESVSVRKQWGLSDTCTASEHVISIEWLQTDHPKLSAFSNDGQLLIADSTAGRNKIATENADLTIVSARSKPN